MANRVTFDEVQAIMGDCEATETQIDPFIDTANLFISNVFTSNTSVTEATLKELEKWLSAHFVAITICRTTIKEELGDAKVEYAGNWGQGLKMTQYGQMVLMLDTTGAIQIASKRQASIYAVTSFN